MLISPLHAGFCLTGAFADVMHAVRLAMRQCAQLTYCVEKTLGHPQPTTPIGVRYRCPMRG